MEVLHETLGKELLDWAVADLDAGRSDALSDALSEIHPSEVANLLEALPSEYRQALWKTVPAEHTAEVLTHLHDEVRAGIIDVMPHSEFVAAAVEMAAEDLADVVEELPEDITERLLNALDQDHRQRLEAALSYEEGTAGRLMSTDVLSVRNDVSIGVVLRWIRRHNALPSHTDALMVIGDDGVYLGKLDIAELLTSDPNILVETVMRTQAGTVPATVSVREVAALFERHDLISIAVLGEQDRLLGRITVDDVVDVIRDEADRTLMHSAGLDEEEDLFAPVLPSAKRRGLWLGINLVTVFLAAWVIGRFEEALDKIVALAVLMPVVASMGGIAGSQTLTLTIRGMALDQIASSNVRWLTVKELAVGGINGIVWAVVVAIVSFIWFRDVGLSLIIASAMVLNLLAAAVSGVTIPLILKRLGLDPALSGAVVLTTVTDVIGFLSFLGLATLFLL